MQNISFKEIEIVWKQFPQLFTGKHIRLYF